MPNPETNELSDRELDILRLVATGASNKEIAQRLAISSNTVKVHLRNIFAKIGATTRTEAAMYAVNAGLVPGMEMKVSEVDEGISEQEVPVQAPLSREEASTPSGLLTLTEPASVNYTGRRSIFFILLAVAILIVAMIGLA